MNKIFQTLSILDAISLFAIACSPQAAQVALSVAAYQAVLGKSINDNNVEDFIASNNCSSTSQFQLCQDAGLALWIDPNQKVDTVYLYALGSNGFAPYQGELPFGLVANDTMANVEQKLGQPKEVHAPQAGWEAGLRNAGSSPDHMQFRADYERFGVTIVYNTPFANDKNATIHSILVTK